MNLKQKIYDLKALQREQSAIIDECLEKGDIESEAYTKAVAEVDKLEAQVKAMEAQMARKGAIGEGQPAGKPNFAAGGEEKRFDAGVLKGLKESDVKGFAGAVRKALNEGTTTAGGYTVPADIVNRIYELVEDEDSFLPYITNTPVTTMSGSRTYKTRSQLQGFSTVAEAAKAGAIAEPTFDQIQYTIAKRSGYLPVTEELLEDSDENITTIVMNWMAAEYRVTINKNAIAVIKPTASSGVKTITNLDGILEVLCKDLGAALRTMSVIHTNNSGLLWLHSLKDNTGRPLLQADPTQPTRMMLGVGAISVPIKVWDDSTITPVTSGNIPFAIGSTKEAVWRFDRKQLTVDRLTEATVGNINLAEQGMVAFKATMRDDYKLRDAKAVKWCEVNPSAAG